MSTRGWTFDELARAIGLRAMGEDYTDIALRLNRPRLEVVRQVGAARSLIRAEMWIQPLLAEPRREEPVEVPVPGTPVLRPYRVRPDIDELAAMTARDNTAALMGDPAPGRSALERKRS
ncbi:hypothetical protein V6L76_17465 [Pannonibacter sp. Pt2]|uniref:GcrA cell cycle regulator n=1 Tax=Pannonibacter anstelovis TaxID=3121537 RepID=A0ABU7ZTF2_9HYPH